ncbi:MAG: hypothetical protein ABIG44_12280 [Planctomycetota bacterium]
MEQREKRWLGREIGELIQRMPDKDARRLRKALATSDGSQLLLDLLSAIYRLPGEQRLAVLARLEQLNQFRPNRD